MRRPARRRVWLFALVGALILGGPPATAQRLPGLGGAAGLPALGVGQIGGDVRGALGDVTHGVDADLGDLADVRLSALHDLVRANPKALDVDAHGAAVVRGEVMAIDPTPSGLEAASRAGFGVLRRSTLDPLGLEIVVLSPPGGLLARDGLRRLRKLDPAGRYDLDHIYWPSGERASAPAAGSGPMAAPGSDAVVGMIDTGVAADHPAIAGDVVAQQGFAPGGVRVGAHGTAVASLMVGRAPGFRGAAPGARLYAADVYGSGPTGGSADAILHALAWMVQQRVGVINMSLAGPANLTLEAAVRAVIARGGLLVAPVGNDGPAAPPLYPASYPGVIAVTAVDGRGRPLPEAGHALHVDFAALGAEVAAAQPSGGFAKVRGTSFAAPIVSGRLALLIHGAGPGEASRAVAELAQTAGSAHGQRGLGQGVIGGDLASAARGTAK